MKNMLMFAAFVLLFTSAFAGISVTEYTVSKESFQPNDQGVITITVTNPVGTGRVGALTMSISTPPEIILTGTSKLSDIESGGTSIVSIPVRIKDGASAGVYLVTVSFTGTSYESGSEPENVLNSVAIPVTVLNPPIFSFTTDKTSLESIDSIKLTISNNGGMAKDARLSTSGIISLYGTNEMYLGDLDGSQEVTLELDSRSAQDGPENLTLVMTYEDELGTEHSDEYAIRMTVKKESLNVAFLQNSDIITREEGIVSLGITNIGNTTLQDVKLVFSNSSLSFKDSTQLVFGDIAPGATAEVSPTLLVDLTPGLNMVEGTLSWVEEDVTREETVSFPLTVSSDADVGVYLEAKPSPLYIGQEHTISVLVSNLGSYAIDNVDVEFSSDAIESMDISNSQYIGSLNNDDFSTVQFKVKVGNVQEGEYPITLDINYRDKSGEWKTKTITKYVNVYTQPTQNGSGLYLLGGFVAVALAAWFFFLRKKPSRAA
jgi:uncharacterized membrane protein